MDYARRKISALILFRLFWFVLFLSSLLFVLKRKYSLPKKGRLIGWFIIGGVFYVPIWETKKYNDREHNLELKEGKTKQNKTI